MRRSVRLVSSSLPPDRDPRRRRSPVASRCGAGHRRHRPAKARRCRWRSRPTAARSPSTCRAASGRCRRPAARRSASPTSSTTRASRCGRPTASTIAFFAYRDGGYDIWAIDPDGSNQRKLTWGPFDDREPVWSHDGTRIAFSSDRGNPLGSDYNIWMLDTPHAASCSS